jgi:predicted nucleotidyltransferase
MSSRHGAGIEPADAVALARMQAMPSGYADLLVDAIAAAAADPRVDAMWVGGSVARGVADAGSDLDLLVAVRDEDFEAFAADVVQWLHAVADLVLAQELPFLPGGAFATTRDCLRLDLVSESTGSLAETPYRYRIPVYDPLGLTASIQPGGHEPGPDVGAMESLVTEFYRLGAIFPAAVVARQDWLLGVAGIGSVQELLYRLFVAANAPLPVMGVKQWSSRLTAHQRDVLAGLPAPTAERASVIAAMQAVRNAFVVEGRAAVEPHGVTWPEDLHDAVEAYWRREGLG